MDFDKRKHFLRTFGDQLYDSVYLLYFAFDTDQEKYDDDVISPLIRASILNSILLLESASNCAIDSLNLSSKFYGDIEKLPFLSKFELFLNRINPGSPFDRGCAKLQRVAELKSIRDFYVHPKVKESKYHKIAENTWDTDYGKTQQLQFPRDPNRWQLDHAILALKTVNDFFNLFFLQWCKLRVDSVVDLLILSDEVNFEYPTGAAIDCVGGLDRAVQEWGIDFAFIGKTLSRKN